MAKIKLGGNPINTCGELPKPGFRRLIFYLQKQIYQMFL